ncbi:hypothetical protein DSC45_32580 [Streptomyces sp. YIM 130001]|uniref:hypothetical protein n=1 Tax=Streptomyces sp. YIM 130001 TaxID=2259644 RepID=UPI000E64AB66|nr:hypothetical protein [Streptomyces sp. YIM 130001]RII08719.1 hypothetical protein DSC45_32580 [Streptomyces sp. YIM 130001]
MDAGEVILTVVALIMVLLFTLGVVVTVKAVRAAKRSVDRTVHQARRTFEDTSLRAKSLAQPGPQGEAAQLRLKLRTSMRATQDALEAGVGEDASLQESLVLFERLSRHGHELEAELQRVQRDPDRTRLAAHIPELTERTDRITEAADSLRWAAHDRASRFAHDELARLDEEIRMESGALRHWTAAEPAEGQPGAASAAPGSTSSPTPPPVSWPEPTLVDGPGTAEQSWPQPTAAEQAAQQAAEGEEPKAIAPSRPPVQYPWQKSPRPESTT